MKKFPVDLRSIGRTLPYDDNGHGTHVAGIAAGNGYDSKGEKSGVAPDASLVALKVLDATGSGTISNVIAAFDWLVANYQTLQHPRRQHLGGRKDHRVVYMTDPLTLAAKKVVDRGIVVVTAAGNFGKNADGHLQVPGHRGARGTRPGF